MNLVDAINKVAEHIALFSSSEYWDAGKLEHCLKAMNMLLAAQSSGGQSPQAPNSPMDAIVRAAINVDAHWREFGPEHGFGEVMDQLYAVLQQRHQ